MTLNLKETCVKYRTLVEATRTGFLILDHLGRVLDANDEYIRISGNHSLTNIRGRRVTDWTAEHDLERSTREIEKCFEKGHVHDLVIDYVDRRGRLTPVEINASAQQDCDERRIFVICRDVSERQAKARQKAREKEQPTQKSLESQKQLRLLGRRLVSIREEESDRIAKGLNRELGQLLSALKVEIGLLERCLNKDDGRGKLETSTRLECMRNLADSAIHEVHQITRELLPAMLEDIGLVAALEWMIDKYGHRSGIHTSFHCDVDCGVYDSDVSISTYRIVQEALTNVERHAAAAQVIVTMVHQNDRLNISVEDNGCGFIEERLDVTHCVGILGMRERAYALNGKIEFYSVPGSGTQINLQIPTGKAVS